MGAHTLYKDELVKIDTEERHIFLGLCMAMVVFVDIKNLREV